LAILFSGKIELFPDFNQIESEIVGLVCRLYADHSKKNSLQGKPRILIFHTSSRNTKMIIDAIKSCS